MDDAIAVMNESRDPPPMYAEITRRFPQATKSGVIFCWGNTIHNPSGIALTNALIQHESVHAQQQAKHEGGPRDWWTQYMHDPIFCMNQEIPAHAAEYLVYCEGGTTRNQRRLYLRAIADRLTGPLYGMGWHRQRSCCVHHQEAGEGVQQERSMMDPRLQTVCYAILAFLCVFAFHSLFSRKKSNVQKQEQDWD